MKQLFSPLMIAILCVSCLTKYRDPVPEKKVMGYKPVYSTDLSLLRVYVSDTKPVKNAGKIYTIGNFIFQNEVGKGLHVFDYSNLAAPQQAGFINIPGNTEVSVKDSFLYANSYADLVVIDIRDWKNAKELKRIKNAFLQGYTQNYTYSIPPPEHNIYYECLVYGRGIQIGWVKDSVSSYSCYYQ